jgi:hypothetical protein
MKKRFRGESPEEDNIPLDKQVIIMLFLLSYTELLQIAFRISLNSWLSDSNNLEPAGGPEYLTT